MVAALGHNVNLVRLSVLLAGAALATFAGVIGGPIEQVTPGVGNDVLLLALIVVVVGGLGSIPGAFVASLIIGEVRVARRLARAAARSPAGGAVRALRRDGADPDRAPRGAVRPMTRSGVVVRLAVLALLVAAPALLDTYNTFLLTEILIFGLFAASLDLLIGYSGLPSLGHGGYYGVGAYAAGLLALHVTTNAFAQIGGRDRRRGRRRGS